ncbi:hypothetical protein [Maribellus mangrovi]|uniref:hypothetical protein n=1 Tax=Maribellus mangrovi TaxID=3133146 RepID=UPI0030EDDEBC
MKVMLPVKQESAELRQMAEGFHNIEFVCIYDNDSKNCEWLEAKSLSKTPGGLNSELLQRGVSTIISLNLTPMVLNLFKRSSIEVLKALSSDINENIRLFEESELPSYSTQESRSLQACNGNSCSSCSSSCA